MRWLSASAAKLACLIAVFWLVLPASSVGAEATTISANLCGSDNQGSSIAVSSPTSDSIIDSPDVTIEGTVSNATQITVSVNDQYSQTVSLGTNQTTFQFVEQIGEGTSTIKLVANDVCQIHNGSATIVLTYQPETKPSNGEETPTAIDNSGAVLISSQAVPVQDQSMFTTLKGVVVIGPIIRLLDTGLRAIGMDVTIQKSGFVMGVTRIILFSTGAMMGLFGAVMLQKYALKWLTAMHLVLPHALRGKHHARLWTLRLFGLIMVATALML